MPRDRRCRNARHAFVTTVIGSIAALSLGATAKATPHLFLSPAASSIAPNESVEIEVFIEEVTDLRLYEVVLEVADGDGGALALTDLQIDEARGDFVFTGLSPLVCLPDLDNLRITCSPLSDDCVSVGAPPAYLGTYTFTASADAHGTFDVNIVEEPTSFLLDCNGDPITPFTVTNATVDVEVPVPTVSEWGLMTMTLLILAAGTMMLRRRQPARA